MIKEETTICVGIDLGTTNTSGSCSRINTDGQIHLEDLQIRQKSERSNRNFDLLPSIMYVTNNGEEVVGEEAKCYKKQIRNNSKSDIRYLENVKRFIGTRKSFSIDGKVYTPIEVATKILSHVKNYSLIKQLRSDYRTIITVPANFNNDQRNDTLEAARRAGFSNVELYDEPKAAILSFLHEESQKRENKLLNLETKKRILVIDIGGGTCDICVEDVEERNGEYVFAHLAVGRDNLGGVDFDQRVGDELVSTSRELMGVELTDSEAADIRDMGQEIKEVFCGYIEDLVWDEYDGDAFKLYNQENWTDVLSEEGYEIDLFREIGGKTISFHMDISTFIGVVDSLVYSSSDSVARNKDEREKNKNMQDLIDSTLEEHGIDIEDVDIIFLTGGMAKCFPLRAALSDIYKKPIISPEEPFLAVSRGAALADKYKNIDETSKDLMPNAIMIEMNNGRLRTLVNAGEQVPVTKTVPETFKTTSRFGVVMRLFEGKNEFDSQLRRINNEYVIKFDTYQKVGREFSIKYTVDRTKRIKFVVTFLDTGEEHIIEGKIGEGK